MAVTKIHSIKTTVDKAIEYICNPDKTDEKIYISSFACAPETAALDFKYTLDHTTEQNFSDGQDKENKAFHLIQAFLPGEVSYEEAHAIGKELADNLLQGKYSYVLTTHIDTLAAFFPSAIFSTLCSRFSILWMSFSIFPAFFRQKSFMA